MPINFTLFKDPIDPSATTAENKYSVFWNGPNFERVKVVADIMARLWRVMANDDQVQKDEEVVSMDDLEDELQREGGATSSDINRELQTVYTMIYQDQSTTFAVLVTKADAEWHLVACYVGIKDAPSSTGTQVNHPGGDETVEGTETEPELWERGLTTDEEETERGPLKFSYREVVTLPILPSDVSWD
ncbi:hypothetical protein EYR40_003006 [Pleurotus pulmonarius]|nr:hypothetical protein EYR36_005455 [Pleurotus pulmonarius]KAF4580608.1 hypothetical protein EYR40_003006 [Pleurotus pulmonarius]KAF4580718.1 hypothetical protein EYR38_003004 [Pleurotus pulmonarius]